MCIVPLRIFPESLRWLLSTQQYSRSKYIMGHTAKKNQINTELDPDLILTGRPHTGKGDTILLSPGPLHQADLGLLSPEIH